GKAHVQDHGHHPGSAKLSGLAPYLGNFDRLAGEFQGRQLGWKDGVANVCEDREIKGLRFDFDSRRSCSPHRCYGLASKLRCRPEMLEQIIDEARAEMVLAKGAFFGVARDFWVPLREMVFEIGKKTVGTEMPWRREIRSRSAWAKIHPTGARILGIRRDDQLQHGVSGPWRDMSARIRRSIPDSWLYGSWWMRAGFKPAPTEQRLRPLESQSAVLIRAGGAQDFCQGFRTDTPTPATSRMLRVTSVKLCSRAVAASRPSITGSGIFLERACAAT